MPFIRFTGNAFERGGAASDRSLSHLNYNGSAHDHSRGVAFVSDADLRENDEIIDQATYNLEAIDIETERESRSPEPPGVSTVIVAGGQLSIERDPSDLRYLLEEDLEEIEDAVVRFRAGRRAAYQTVAIQLRNLLTDRSSPLLRRVVSNPTFEALATSERLEPRIAAQRTWTFDPRRLAEMSTAAPYLTVELAVQPDNPVPVVEWVDDWIISPTVSIRDLIHQTANKDVAHTEVRMGPAMHRLEANQSLVISGRPVDVRPSVIVGIGAYAARRIRHLLDDALPTA